MKFRRLTHLSFEVGLLIKSVVALLETLSGAALIFLTPERMNTLIGWVSRNELSEDPTDWLMNYLLLFGRTFSVSAQQFSVFYFLSHGLVKLIVLFLLWRRKLWAYPLSIFVFLGFIVYQVVRFTSTHSAMLLVLTVLDAAMIALTILEWQSIRKTRRSLPPS